MQTIEPNPQPQDLIVHEKACKNCHKLHRKCNRQMPCDYCSLRGKPCEINPAIKKRGRPLGSTNKKTEEKIGDEKEPKKVKKMGKPKKSKETKDPETKNPFSDDFALNMQKPSIIQSHPNYKKCISCQAHIVVTAKFCTNCGAKMDQIDSTLHSTLDSLRLTNSILEQQLHAFAYSSEIITKNEHDKKSLLPAVPALISLDLTSHLESNPSLPCPTESHETEPKPRMSISFPSISPLRSNSITFFPSRLSNSNIFEFSEPAIFLDSSTSDSEQMISWATSLAQKKDMIEDVQLYDLPIFRENLIPRF